MELSNHSEAIKKPEQMYVYVLELVDRTHYTGMTANIKRRLQEHQAGQSRSTLARLPVKLIFLLKIEGRKEARKLEVRIKQKGAKQWLNYLRFSPMKYEYDIQDNLHEYD